MLSNYCNYWWKCKMRSRLEDSYRLERTFTLTLWPSTNTPVSTGEMKVYSTPRPAHECSQQFYSQQPLNEYVKTMP